MPTVAKAVGIVFLALLPIELASNPLADAVMVYAVDLIKFIDYVKSLAIIS